MRRSTAETPRSAPDSGHTTATRPPATARDVLVMTLVGVVSATALLGCGIGSSTAASLDATPTPIPPAAGPGATAPSTTTAPPPADDGDATAAAPEPASGAAPAPSAELTVVTDALDRYDRALSALSAAPEAVDDPADALLAEWHAITLAGSDLDQDVVARIRGRRDEGIVVMPPGNTALSYVHHVRAAVRVVPPAGLADPPEEISFTWCGWSPGIGRRIGTDTVVDDVVGGATGTGMVRRDAETGTWMVGSLLETSFDALAPGSADPCV
jgi:hypothetical protein